MTTTTTSSRLDSNMGSSTQTSAAPASRGSKNRKRPREVKDEINNEIKDEDEGSSAILTHRHRRRRRNSRSRTPSPSPSLGGNDNTPEEEDISLDDLPASLDRHACLRCVRFLASEPAFECEFPARSIKCTRCTRLNSKCEPIPAFADAEARRILSLQTKYEHSPPCEVGNLRDRVVAAAEAFTVSVRMEAQRRPKTLMEINLAILRGQEEMIGLLRSIKAELIAQGGTRKGRGRERGEIRLGYSATGPVS